MSVCPPVRHISHLFPRVCVCLFISHMPNACSLGEFIHSLTRFWILPSPDVPLFTPSLGMGAWSPLSAGPQLVTLGQQVTAFFPLLSRRGGESVAGSGPRWICTLKTSQVGPGSSSCPVGTLSPRGPARPLVSGARCWPPPLAAPPTRPVTQALQPPASRILTASAQESARGAHASARGRALVGGRGQGRAARACVPLPADERRTRRSRRRRR